MAEPARQLPEEDKAVTKPNLRALEGSGQGDGQPTGNLKAVSKEDAEASKSVAPEELGSAEAASGTASNSESGGNFTANFGGGYGFYKGESNKTKSSGRIKGFFWGTGSRKKKTLAGGTIGLLVGGTFLGLSIVSGPFEFIHIAQLLEQFHFSTQESQGDDRLSKDARFIYYAQKGEIQKTRLGFLGNQLANTIEGNLNNSGIVSAYQGTYNYFDGYVIDPSNANFAGQTPEQIKQNFQENYGVTVTDGTGDLSGKLVISGKNLNYTNSKALIKNMMLEAGYDNISTAVGWRIMGRRASVTWHPISNLDESVIKSLDAQLLAWRERRAQSLDDGTEPTNLTVEENPEEGSNGKPDPNAADEAAQAGSSATDTQNQGTAANEGVKTGDLGPLGAFRSSVGFKLATGGAAAIGVACLARGVAVNYDSLKQSEVILPLMRMGMEAVTLGNQVMDGQDADLTQLGFYSGLLSGTDSAGNDTSWNQAQSIQAELGEPQTGVAPDNTLQSVGSGNPLNFLLTGVLGSGLKGLCNTPVQAVTTVISFLGGPVSTILGTAIGALAVPKVESLITNWLSGLAVNVFSVGGDYGNDINYGTLLSSNEQAIASGGRQLSSPEADQLQNSENNLAQANFNKQSLAYKLFNPGDYRSLLSRIMDQQSPGVSNNLNHYAGVFTGLGKTLAALPSEIFGSTVHAAGTTNYNYGIPQYGFSEAEMDSPYVENPYQNADTVAGLLSGGNGQDYINRVKACFNDTIAQNSSGQWDVMAANANSAVAAYSSSYSATQASDNCNETCQNPNNCSGADLDWMRIRFFIFDTETMESVACYQGDDQSCDNVGFGGSSPTTTSTTSDSAQQLAQQLLTDKNVQLTGRDVLQDVQDAANGQPGTAGAMTSAAILQLIIDVSQNHTTTISAIQSGGTGHCNNTPKSACPTDPHYNGDAVDFSTLDGVALTGRDTGSLEIMNIAFSVLPDGSRFGQEECGVTPTLPPGFSTFDDTCNHLHVDVPAGTP